MQLSYHSKYLAGIVHDCKQPDYADWSWNIDRNLWVVRNHAELYEDMHPSVKNMWDLYTFGECCPPCSFRKPQRKPQKLRMTWTRTLSEADSMKRSSSYEETLIHKNACKPSSFTTRFIAIRCIIASLRCDFTTAYRYRCS
jgi:hypothetical protein